ncbi:MAG: hypothetical protein ABIV94_00860 [Acidimicrobiales bacterium]
MSDPAVTPKEKAVPARNALGETRRHVLVRRWIITGIVLSCVAALAVAATHTRRGDDASVGGSPGGPSPEVVELLTPAGGDTLVNQQAQIGIDLTTPYQAFLLLNGVQIPDDELLKRPELSAVYFTPGEDKFLKALPPGQNCVQAVISRVDGTDQAITPITWCFRVA